MKPQKCPFCRSSVSLIDSAKVFGCSYGFIYLCNSYPKCDARVGCHPGTITPLGTLADKDLRKWRRKTHRKFDPLWQSGVFPDRQAAYKWLSKAMRLPLERTHVAMFDIRQCQRAIACVEVFTRIRQRVSTKVTNPC
ncbi:zinc-finger-containing protein [Synechocystis sp. PCC 7509]|uniref:zinc-finger-containing protein n=1 Tax=Synechocystis sp. PCC 7509 TaxID=927677 RepID=UPI0002ABF138|nr:zinc-finger-containing protein [Synechocystis sp. PCC 7509]